MSWETYNQRRVQNIKEQVDMADVLEYYNVPVMTRDREFQYPCPLHGDGQDNSFSARLYPSDDGGSTFCFACNKSRDVVEWVRDAELLAFGKALSWIERTFSVKNVPKPSFDLKDKEGQEQFKQFQQLFVAHQHVPSLMDHIHRTDIKLRHLIKADRSKYSLDSVAKIFFVLDALKYDLQHDEKTPEQTAKTLKGVIDKIHEWELR